MEIKFDKIIKDGNNNRKRIWYIIFKKNNKRIGK